MIRINQCSFWYMYNTSTRDYYFKDAKILITLASSFTRMPCMIFFANTLFYWFNFIYNGSYHCSTFCFELHFLPSNLHLHLQEIWFAGDFDSFISFIILNTLKFTSCFIWHTCSTTWVFSNMKTPMTPVYTNDEWIVGTFIRIQINNQWSDYSWLIIYNITVINSIITNRELYTIPFISGFFMLLTIKSFETFYNRYGFVSGFFVLNCRFSHN